jgi:hypothetical protein
LLSIYKRHEPPKCNCSSALTACFIFSIGGKSNILGSATLPVKIGKSQHEHLFQVLKQPLAGFEVLLGQDYMKAVGCAIQLTKHLCTLLIGEDLSRPVAKVVRPLRDSLPIELNRQTHAASAIKFSEPSPQQDVDLLSTWAE